MRDLDPRVRGDERTCPRVRGNERSVPASAGMSGSGLRFDVLLQPRHQLDEVAGPVPAIELPQQNIVPGFLHRTRTARQGEQVGAAGNAAERAGLDRGRADLLIAQHPEQLTEALDALLHHALESFRRHVAAGDPGAAGCDDRVDLRVRDPAPQSPLDPGGIVLLDSAGGNAVAGLGDPFGQRIARCVVRFRARVGDRQHGDVDGHEQPTLVDARHITFPAGSRSGSSARRGSVRKSRARSRLPAPSGCHPRCAPWRHG